MINAFLATRRAVVALALAVGIAHAAPSIGSQVSHASPDGVGSEFPRVSEVIPVDAALTRTIDDNGRTVSVTDAYGRTASFAYDDVGRISVVTMGGRTAQFFYTSPSSATASFVLRNGRLFSVSNFKDVLVGQSYGISSLAKGTGAGPGEGLPKYYSYEEDDPLRLFGDYMASCAANPLCFAAGGSDWFSSVSSWVSQVGAWLAAGGFLGAAYGVTIEVLGGAASTAALAEAIAIYGFLGMAAAAAFVGGVYVGTWVYDSVGNAIWLSV